LTVALAVGAVAQTPKPVYQPDELIVGVTPVAHQTGVARQAVMAVGDIAETLPQIGVHRVKIHRGMSLEQAAARIAAMPGVRFVEPNYILTACATPNDPSFATQYGPKKIQADLAWGIWNPVAPVVIAIVDSGVDSNHPDLTNKILRDAQGIVGYDAISLVRSDALDDNGHGTHCAGIAAAEINNGIGIAGIAGWNGTAGSDTTYTKIMPVKVLNAAGSGSTTQVANGILWAADNGANVISLSLGGSGTTTLSNAVSYAWSKGCIVVCAAGNNGSSTLFYPAAYSQSLAVAATDSTDTLCSFSNYGSWVQVAAPGNSIYSTYPNNSYATMSGTSMACPHVSGAAALIWSANPTLTNADVKALLMNTTDPYNPYNGRTIGGGRINVYRAMGGQVIIPAPAAPTKLTAKVATGSVTLSWKQSTSSGITNNKVYRSTSSSSGFTVLATISPATQYVDRSVSKGTTYYYKVTAVNAGGVSAFSNTASARAK